MNKQNKKAELTEQSNRTAKERRSDNRQSNNTTKHAASSSRNYIGLLRYIGTGENNAIHGRELSALTGLSIREITLTIEQARNNGEVILSSHKGYFKPETMLELTEYINRERSRAKSILETLRTAEEYQRKAERE